MINRIKSFFSSVTGRISSGMKSFYNKWSGTLFLACADCLITLFSGGLAMLVRFEFSFEHIPGEILAEWYRFIPIELAATLVLFWFLGMYSYVLVTLSSLDISKMFLSCVATSAVIGIIAVILRVTLSASIWFMIMAFKTIGCTSVRYSSRISESIASLVGLRKTSNANRIMLIGAGSAGSTIMREIRSSGRKLGDVICVIDDDPSKVGKDFYGAKIVGGREAIVTNSEKYKIDEIFIAVPSADREIRKELIQICSQTSCRIKILPGIYQLINDEVGIAALRDVSIQDLLGRDQIELDMSGIYGFLSGKKILVTGAGGSIGSELCRQIVQYDPSLLVGLDIYEKSLYDIQQELKRTYGDSLDFRAEVASIRDKEKIYSIFEQIRPDIVFHAAAHKHVPLMENAPDEAIKNNVFGTYHVVRAAEKYGVSKFIMISTDKAVNPTNIMGATKRFCEMVLQSRQDSVTEFASVRFGNVLGSNGSVVPLFKKQIEEGGPVTITDKRIIRYFMTISEACSLVLEAGAMAKRNQVFILDMGDPVKILDLAEEMIRLAGLRPYKDIPIVEIGLRPGEKLYEELLMSRDNLQKTANSKIFIEEQEPLTQEFIMSCLQELDNALENGVNREEAIALLRRIIPTYQPPETVNSRFE